MDIYTCISLALSDLGKNTSKGMMHASMANQLKCHKLKMHCGFRYFRWVFLHLCLWQKQNSVHTLWHVVWRILADIASRLWQSNKWMKIFWNETTIKLNYKTVSQTAIKCFHLSSAALQWLKFKHYAILSLTLSSHYDMRKFGKS